LFAFFDEIFSHWIKYVEHYERVIAYGCVAVWNIGWNTIEIAFLDYAFFITNFQSGLSTVNLRVKKGEDIPPGCQCHLVMIGKIRPKECPLF